MRLQPRPATKLPQTRDSPSSETMSLNSTPARRKSKWPWKTIAWVAAGAVVLAGGGYMLFKPKEPKDPYRLEVVSTGDISRTVSASGTLQALVTVQVGSQISGQIKEVRVDFNDTVRRGQVMAVLDPETYRSRQTQGRAEIAASQASLNQLQAQAEVARANYNRTKSLFDKGIVAQAALDTDLAAWKAAQANVEAGRARLNQSRASLAATEIDLARTTIIAPIDGVVVDRQIEPGQTVAASLSAPVLFQIAQDLSKLEVKISVDEADIGQVQEGQTVRFTVDAFPDDNFTGVVTQVRMQPETSANVVAYTVIAQAENPGRRLLPGMTANADIILEQRPGVMRVPAAAVRWTPPDTSGQRRASAFPGAAPGAAAGGQRRQGGGQGAGGQGGQGGGQRGGGMAARIIEALDLDAGQQKKAEAIFAEARQKAQNASGEDRRTAMRAAMEEAFTKLDAILKPEQKTRLAAMRARMGQGGGRGQGRGSMTQGTVWILVDGKPQPVSVMIGATDGSFVEIVDRSGKIKPGSQVIVGGGPKAPAQVRGGPMGGGPRVRM